MVSSAATEQHARPPPHNHRSHHDAGQNEPPTARQPESRRTGRWRQHPPVPTLECEQRYGTLRATRMVRGQERKPRTTRQPLQTAYIPDAGHRQEGASHPPHCSVCRTWHTHPVAGVVDCARPTQSAINADTGMAAARPRVPAEGRFSKEGGRQSVDALRSQNKKKRPTRLLSRAPRQSWRQRQPLPPGTSQSYALRYRQAPPSPERLEQPPPRPQWRCPPRLWPH